MSIVKERQKATGRPPAGAPILGWRSIAVHVEPYEEALPRLTTAVALAARCNAHLIGIGAEVFESGIFATPIDGAEGLASAFAMHVQANLAHAGRRFEERAKGLSHEWFAVEEHPVRILAAASRAADLIVAGGSTSSDDNRHRVADAAELAILSGRPVLVAPPDAGPLEAKAAVVAWKDTREARRAVADALPLLKAARRVLVLEVSSPEERLAHAQFHTYEVASWLKRHGVRAEPRAIAAPEPMVARTLQAHADSLGADLIVAGCYGHSRLNEWIFGGVTRDLLRIPQRFVLMSH